MHKKTTYDFGDTIEVDETCIGRYGAPGEPREKKRTPTPEQIKKQNRWNKEKKIRRKMKENFKENDYWVTLTYRKELRPEEMEEASKDIRKFMERMRKFYKKKGKEFKWMRHTEVGSRGGIHHHLVISRIEGGDIALRESWKKGGVHLSLLYSEGGFRKLANYLAKEPDTNNKLKESRYSCSRNLKIPKGKEKVLRRWKEEPKAKKGYYIEKDTYHDGICARTGRRYRSYTMIKLDRRI